MELTELFHIDDSEILNFEPDIFIAASGFESRSISIPEKFSSSKCRKVTLAFTDMKDVLSRLKNDQYYKENDFEFISQKSNEVPDFDKILATTNNVSVKILIDISVMTKLWYYSLLKYLSNIQNKLKIILRIVYCPAKFSEAPVSKGKLSLNKFDIVEFNKHSESRKEMKSVLIMGLGIEPGIGRMIYDILNPDKTYLFYADPPAEKKYIDSLFINNHQLIQNISIKNLISYPLNNTCKLHNNLLDVILPLREKHRLMLVPLGPKIFALLCMILQISYPDLELFLPKRKVKKVKDRIALSTITGLELHFESI